MKAHANSFDFLLNTIPVSHDINPYIVLLRDRTMAMVGVLTELDRRRRRRADPRPQIGGRLAIGGSRKPRK
jgi:D-arabinose 1-dehydrogenase-like Zn-dependent alcohol dehydrogenase